jgi:hypothetical protein
LECPAFAGHFYLGVVPTYSHCAVFLEEGTGKHLIRSLLLPKAAWGFEKV